MDIHGAINEYGFPLAATGSLGMIFHYIYSWITHIVSPTVHKINMALTAAIEKINKLDREITELHERVEAVVEKRQMNIERESTIASKIDSKMDANG